MKTKSRIRKYRRKRRIKKASSASHSKTMFFTMIKKIFKKTCIESSLRVRILSIMNRSKQII
jgi:hypothetical protein